MSRRDQRKLAVRSRAIVWAVSALSRVDNVVRGVQGIWWRVLERAVTALLSSRELEYLTMALYELRARHAGRDRRALFGWEQEWLSERLPPVPARVLVGAAGGGREVAALVRAGYEVDAFEPCGLLVGRCADLLREGGVAVQGHYEELARAVLEGKRDTPLGQLAFERYEAVLLGWGSLSHLLDPERRRRLIEACHKLTPSGPILTSFWSSERATEWGDGQQGLGVQSGMAGTGSGEAPSGRPIVFRPWFGAACFLDRKELRRLASTVGRPLIWEERPGAFPHVTLLPKRHAR